MSSIHFNFVIASENPLELAKFYAEFNDAKAFQEVSSFHCFISLRNGAKIQIYTPSHKKPSPNRSVAVAPFFYKDPCKKPMPCLQEWISDLIQLGAQLRESPREEDFGCEVWMNDPELNQFLILVPNDLGPYAFL